MTDDRIAPVDAVPADSTLLFRVRDDDGVEREAFLVRAGDRSGADSNGEAGGGADTDAGGDGAPDDGGGGPTGGEANAAADAADDPGPPSVRAWLNECQHFTHVRLDKGDGATMRDGEVVCRNHGAMFDAGSGRCTFGPCEGAYLRSLAVVVRDGAVHLTEDGHEFLGRGPAEDDGDLTSTSNVEF